MQEYAYFQQCIDLPLSTLACKNFWIALDVIVVAIASMLLMPIIIRGIKTNKAYKIHLQRLQDREKVADPEIMGKHKWSGYSSALDQMTQNEAAEKIREALEAKK